MLKKHCKIWQETHYGNKGVMFLSLPQGEEYIFKTAERRFHRSNHNVKLTEDGMLLRKRAKEIPDLVEKRNWNDRVLSKNE